MRRSHLIVGIVAIGIALVAACSDSALDPTVIFDHEPGMAQPWTASGDLVDAGLLCPSGDRENTGLWNPDGTPMSIEALVDSIETAMENGGSHWDVPRYGWEEYVCDDGSGTFTILETVTSDSPGQMTGEIIDGTGVYAGMEGECVIDVTEDENHELLEMIGTCELTLPDSSDG